MTQEISLQLFSEAVGEGDAQGADTAADTDTQGAQAEAESTEEEKEERTQLTAEEEFEALIKGKFSKEFARRTQSIIDRRFAKAKNDEQQLRDLQPLLDEIRKIHPDISPDNIPSLVKAIQGTRTPEKTRGIPDLGKLRTMKAQLEEKRAAAEKQRIIADWEKQAQSLKEIYPDFSLSKEVLNEDFAQLLRAGVSVRRAYEAANIEGILGSAMHYAAATVGRKAAQSIRTSSARVQENSVLDRAASKKSTNVNLLTEKDILNILEEVKRGTKISF